MSTSAYPVHVDASLDSHLSRWLWLVKWLLAIPHYFVLAFLWLAFFLLSVIAFFAIAFTGRYPRAIFDFNVGVLRWNWRVAYYTYGALGTDRYPPFTLAEVPDYPAHLTVDYPEHLSRGLVWVKWWLLAIPHYLIVGILLSGGIYFAWNSTTADGAEWTGGWGLITLLAVIAAFVLLFTGRYPQQLFDLILGLNRWVLRVAAYATLMTDEYPPFRLDMGGQDPAPARFALSEPPAAPGVAQGAAPGAPPAATATSAAPPASGTPPTSSAAAPPSGGGITWGPGRIITVIVAAVVFLMAGGFLAGGTALAVADQTLRNDQGYLMSPTQTFETGGYAIASEPFLIETGTASDWVPRSLVGDVAVEAEAPPGQEVFIGVARAADAARYLSGVQYATVLDITDVDGEPTPVYREHQGSAPEALPTDPEVANTWVTSASGPGQQQLVWEPASGDYTVVVMNADGDTAVSADLAAGATLPVLDNVMIGLFIAGALLLVLSIALVLIALTVGRHPASGAPASAGPAPGGSSQEGPR
jgi:Domain of unknown function (DUF4389)